VKILIIGTNAETGFYSRMERRGIGQAACRNSKQVRVWVVRSMRKLGWRPKKVNEEGKEQDHKVDSIIYK